MLFYAGAGNTTALSRGIDAAKKRAETLVKPDRSRHRSCSHRNAVAGATGKPHRSTIARPANQAEGVRARGARRTPNGSQRIYSQRHRAARLFVTTRRGKSEAPLTF